MGPEARPIGCRKQTRPEIWRITSPRKIWQMADSPRIRPVGVLPLGAPSQALSAAGIVAVLAIAAWQQTGYWRNSETLWLRDLLYPNLVGRYNLGLALADDKALPLKDRHEAAIRQFQRAYEISPADKDTLYAYGLSLEALDSTDGPWRNTVRRSRRTRNRSP